YTPIPQAVPGPYLIDIESCLNVPPNYIPCDRCYEACAAKAIDFNMPSETETVVEVGSIIVATGYKSFDPRLITEYGYGQNPDVLTAMEFERLISSAGPTGGEILRPSDGKHPENILFVLCVGSRDKRFFHYCSRFCCMYSIKHAYQALDHGVHDVDVLYMDIRAFGKGFDGFWQRTKDEGAHFLRGRPSRIRSNGNQRLSVLYEDTEKGKRVETDYDMVVLATAVSPPSGMDVLAQRLGIELDGDGFIWAQEGEGGLVVTSRHGIYAAGCAAGPKDIPDSVAEGSGAAALALGHLTHRHWPEPLDVEPIEDLHPSRVGVFVCHCGSNIAGVVDVEDVAEYALGLPDVVYTTHQMFSCGGNTQKEMEEAIKAEGINRVVVAACSPKTHEAIFRGVLERAGLNPFLLVMSNIRNMDSWVHKNEKQAATQKAKDMVSMAVEKARLLEPLHAVQLPVTKKVLVVGGGIAGMTASVALAHQGFETHLVEQQDKLGGMLNQLDEIAPSNLLASDLVKTKARQVKASKVKVHLNETVANVQGVVGSFDVELMKGKKLKVGAIVVATGSEPYQPDEFGYGEARRVITNLELESMLEAGEPEAEHITFVSCVGSREDSMGCSRYCCTSMIGQAHRLRKMGKKVRVLFKDIRTYSRQAEESYEAAMRDGVQFIRYPEDQPLEEAIQFEDGMARVYDSLLGEWIGIPTDLLVLVLGLKPTGEELTNQMKLSRSEDGFLMELHPKLGPAETATQGIFLAGSAQGAKDVRESVAQALAASAKAGALLSRGVIEKEPITAVVNEELCTACMRCVKVCPFGAIEQIGPIKEGKIVIHEAACMGCGTCAAECNFHAIEMPYFTHDQMMAQIDAALAERAEEKCLVFTCNWCSYAGADLAGIEKRQYPPSALIIRTMCSARLDEAFVARAFEQGAGAVLVTGCRLTDTGSDCHYNYANRITKKRFEFWQRKYGKKGIEGDRLRLQWISAAEGKEFAETITEMDEIVSSYAQKLKRGELAGEGAD
ncbi:MAG: hydrogenase iron-sulfur subunit, partial [Anaerolineales bacterium]